MMYGKEYWAINRKLEQTVSAAEMRMLRSDNIRNEYIRGGII